MSGEDSGFMSNKYAYEPLRVEDGMWKEGLGAVGGAIGKSLAETTPFVLNVVGPGGKAAGAAFSAAGAVVLEQAGTAAGQQIGHKIDNIDTITKNAETFFTEINDWKVAKDAMANFAGGWHGP